MAMQEATGHVVVLNGSSSAGKSSLARALQARWAAQGDCWVIFGWDDFMPRLPARWQGGPGEVGDLAEVGSRYRIIQDDGLTLTAILEPGPLGRDMLKAYHWAVAALARRGIDVLVEEVLMTLEEWEDWGQALEGLEVCWVGVRCDLEVASARERARGNRYLGLARGTGLVVHRYATYDVEIDTSSLAVEQLAAQLDVLVRSASRSASTPKAADP